MPSILVVDDYRDNRNVVELILQDAEYNVISATDGAAGVCKAMDYHPDLILMDLSMPNLDGWEATRQLKANPQTRNIPVIAFTAQVDDNSVDRAVLAGCAAVIFKPFDIDTLLEQIDACLSGARGVTKAA